MPVLRAAALLALAAPAAALLAGAPALSAPKPIVASRAGLAVATVSDLEEETPAFIQTVSDLGITAMRLGTCALMVHHGFDKIENVEGFSANVVAKFFGFLPGPPQFWTLSAAVTQIVGSGFLSIGLFARPVALSMLATMGTAVVFHLLNTGGEGFPLAVVKAHSYNYELAAMYVIVLGYFAAAGAGPLSVDEQILGGEIAFYQKLTQNAQAELDAEN